MKLFRLIILCLFSSVSSMVWAEDNALLSILQQTQTLSAAFEQTVTDNNNRVVQTDKGIIKVRSPHQLRWQANEPFQQLIVTDGTTLWRFDPDLEQVIISGFNPELEQIPALLFSGTEDEIQKNWNITAQDHQQWQLTPKKDDSLFESLTLTLDDNHNPKTLSIVDRLGQTTTIHFSDVIKNTDIPIDVFTFVAPEGIDVIQQF